MIRHDHSHLFFTSQGTCQDMDRSPNSTINHLPDEVLLEVFDSYRQGGQSSYQWRKKHAWFNLAHVCRRWRAVVFASSSRLDLNITVGPENKGRMKTMLSGRLPILIDYYSGDLREPISAITGSALRRMRAVLRHHDRVRGISFGALDVENFISAANYHFPALESLALGFSYGQELDIPATFLRGPDQSDLRLRRLRLYGPSLTSVTGLLLSATALTDLTLADSPVYDCSQGPLLLACLQGMQCLRSLDLSIPHVPRGFKAQHSTPKDIVSLLKLTRFHYDGSTIFLNYVMSGLSAPSLQNVYFEFCDSSRTSPFLYLSRVIDDLREEFRSISVKFDLDNFCLLSWTHLGKIDYSKPSLWFNMRRSPDSIKSINSMPPTKFAMVEELALYFNSSNIHVFTLREFLRQFCSVRALLVDPFMREVGLYLQHDVRGGILPVLEKIELSNLRLTGCLTGCSDEEYRRYVAQAIAAFESFVSSRERAGRRVKVSLCERRGLRL